MNPCECGCGKSARIGRRFILGHNQTILSPTFDQCFDRRGEDECWLWIKYRYSNGYGRFSHNGRFVLAHRYAYQIATGEDITGLVVRHSCDTPACVNPRHLSSGTQRDNIDDARKKRRLHRQAPQEVEDEAVARYLSGMTADEAAEGLPIGRKAILTAVQRRHPDSYGRGARRGGKVSEDEVREIRKAHAAGGVSYKKLGELHGLSANAIGCIVTRKTWKHVD